MKKLPKSEVYEKEFEYMPWGILIKEILEIIEKDTSKGDKVIDLMCGPGYLLGEISKKRPDLALEGNDISKEFIEYARKRYPNVAFNVEDILSWNSKEKYNLVLCTAGVHHLPYNKQEALFRKASKLLKPGGFIIFADPYIGDYSTELERKKAAAKLGYEYLLATIENNAPKEVTKAALDILYNDVNGFEYKTSMDKVVPVLKKLFSNVKVKKTWPLSDSEYGDYYIICKN